MTDIPVLLAKAVNDELIATPKDHVKYILEFLVYVQGMGVSHYWTVMQAARRTEYINQNPAVAAFLIGISERFLILLHQDLIKAKIEQNDTDAVVSVFTSCWFKETIEAIVELRSTFALSDTISEFLAAELTFPNQDLTDHIQKNHWMLTLYVCLVNGIFSNLDELAAPTPTPEGQ